MGRMPDDFHQIGENVSFTEPAIVDQQGHNLPAGGEGSSHLSPDVAPVLAPAVEAPVVEEPVAAPEPVVEAAVAPEPQEDAPEGPPAAAVPDEHHWWDVFTPEVAAEVPAEPEPAAPAVAPEETAA